MLTKMCLPPSGFQSKLSFLNIQFGSNAEVIKTGDSFSSPSTFKVVSSHLCLLLAEIIGDCFTNVHPSTEFMKLSEYSMLI